MRIFLDANVLFSASRSAGAIRALLQLLEQEGHALVADAYVVEEARRNLAFKAPAEALQVLEALSGRLEMVPMRQTIRMANLDLDWLDVKDRPVLAAAIAAQCDILVTGDKTHFGPRFGQSISGVRLCSPAQLYELL